MNMKFRRLKSGRPLPKVEGYIGTRYQKLGCRHAVRVIQWSWRHTLPGPIPANQEPHIVVQRRIEKRKHGRTQLTYNYSRNERTTVFPLTIHFLFGYVGLKDII